MTVTVASLDHAIRLAARYPVFPCRADKAPACKHGFKSATRDLAGVVDLWRASPGPLIGVPTGSVSGIDALDIDPRHGGDTWLAESADALPITQINHTRSGGRHYLFAHAAGVRSTASKIAPGVDTRGDGGYIVWWPATGCTVETSDTIDDWPRWVLRILCPPKAPRQPQPKPATKAEADTRAAIMIERARNRVRQAPPGERHFQLRAAAATLGGLIRFLPSGQADIEKELVRLVMEAGGESQVAAEKTARWAMSKGIASPLLARR